MIRYKRLSDRDRGTEIERLREQVRGVQWVRDTPGGSGGYIPILHHRPFAALLGPRDHVDGLDRTPAAAGAETGPTSPEIVTGLTS